MAVYNYRLANSQTRWFFIIDLPPVANGRRRRQHRRQRFPNQVAALKAEQDARAAYGRADLGADGTVAAELLSRRAVSRTLIRLAWLQLACRARLTAERCGLPGRPPRTAPSAPAGSQKWSPP